MSYNELYHHGIKGQRWGIRRFQNEDGSLTEAGVAKYNAEAKAATRKATLNNLNAKAKNERKLIKTESRAERAVIKEQLKADKKLAKINNRAAVIQSKNEKRAIKAKTDVPRIEEKAKTKRSKLRLATTVALTAIGVHLISKAIANKNSGAAKEVTGAGKEVAKTTVENVIHNNSGVKVSDISSNVIDAEFTVINDVVKPNHSLIGGTVRKLLR